MPNKWVVVADNSRARIFQTTNNLDELTELEDFLNTAGRAENHEIDSDAHGHFYGTDEHHQGYAAEPAMNAVERRSALFTREITHRLEQGRQRHQYDDLILVAAPHFLGSLRKQLPKQVGKLVTQVLPHDVSALSLPQIRTYLKTHLH
jgi:protein required for attachment to host cells